MYFAFDTETTGVPRAHLDLSHPAQPHLIQFAGVVFDERGSELEHLITIVKPGRGALMSQEAYMAHRISLERAAREGMEPLDIFSWFREKAATATCLVGHNIQFDLQIMAVLAQRTTGARWSPPCPTFCTMTEAAPILNLPPTVRMRAAGRNHPKPPSLEECYRHFFGEELTNAHDAGADVDATIQIFRYLKFERGPSG